MNYFKLYIGDYQRDTSHLSLAEHGAFHMMLQFFYATERPLPTGKALYRMLRANTKAEQKAIDYVSKTFWISVPEGLINERAIREIEQGNTRKLINQESGRRGGRPQKTQAIDSQQNSITDSVSVSDTELVDNSVMGSVCDSDTDMVGSSVSENETETETEPKPTENPIHSHNHSHNHIPEPIPRNTHIGDSQKGEQKASPSRRKSASLSTLTVGKMISDVPNLSAEIAHGYLEHRRAKKNPLTDLAWKSIANELLKYGGDPNEALLFAANKGWTGFQAQWMENEKSSLARTNGKSAIQKNSGVSGNGIRTSAHSGFAQRDYTQGINPDGSF